MESKCQRLLTHEIKTNAPHSRRCGKWREKEKRRGPTGAAKGPESSEKYDGELIREEEEEDEEERESIRGVKLCQHRFTAADGQTDAERYRKQKPPVRIQHFPSQCHIYLIWD